MFCHDMRHYNYVDIVEKSAHGIEAVFMYFNGSGIWGGNTPFYYFKICIEITNL